MKAPQAAMLGRRLHLNHGPIDIIAEAFGDEPEIRLAYSQAVARFRAILEELVAELPQLRAPVAAGPRLFSGPTAQRMESAVQPFFPAFITPMAAVAGSVADEVLSHMVAGRALSKAYANNGGDSSLHLAQGEHMTLAIAGTGSGRADRIVVGSGDEVRGVATSGWRGRSFSLGIADAVTVLARSGAEADAAATIIANAVDLPGHAAIRRAPASSLQPDSDLGGRMVTVGVGRLGPHEVAEALDAGLQKAEELRGCGLIVGAALFLEGESRTTGYMAALMPPHNEKTPGSFQHA
ncbi:MAG: UPF0280 family protein [Rhizobiaceae bacterium]|nr:UPF0280 family protein [Rhizobiaceae bacterium]